MVNIPINPNDRKVDFPSGRPSYMPDIYICDEHPLHKGSGKAYYYIQDGSPEGMARVVGLEHNELSVPTGGEQEALLLGFLKLVPGDCVFVRLISDAPTGVDDVPVCWLSDINLFSEDLVERVKNVRSRVLGPRPDRSRNMPQGSGGDREGGTRFERDFPPGNNVRGGRCYPYGASFEGANKVYAPCAQSKADTTDPEVISYRSDLLNVTVEMATISLRAGPDQVADGLSLNHRLMNFPCIGAEDNFYFGSNQLNLAHAALPDLSENLESSLGNAGAAHIDPNDSPAHFTNMTSISDLPDAFDPGRFFVLYPGVFYELGEFSSFCFSGLRRHGGTLPVAPATADKEEKDWAVRATLVTYPLNGSVSHMQRRVLCGDGLGGSFKMSPEMIIPKPLAEFSTHVTHSTFAREGPIIMSRRSLMDFFCRSFLQLVVFVLQQVSPSLKPRVDSDAFLASFSYEDETGIRRGVKPWFDGPGWRKLNNSTSASSTDDPSSGHDADRPFHMNDQSAHVQELSTAWKHFFKKFAGHVPYAVAVRKEIDPLEGWDGEEPPKKITSLKYPKGKGKRTSDAIADEDDIPSSGTVGKNTRNANGNKGGAVPSAVNNVAEKTDRKNTRTNANGSKGGAVPSAVNNTAEKTDHVEANSSVLSAERGQPQSDPTRGVVLSDVDCMDIDDWFYDQASSTSKYISSVDDVRLAPTPSVGPVEGSVPKEHEPLFAEKNPTSNEQTSSPDISTESTYICNSISAETTADPMAGQPTVDDCLDSCEVDWDAVAGLSDFDRMLLTTGPAVGRDFTDNSDINPIKSADSVSASSTMKQADNDVQETEDSASPSAVFIEGDSGLYTAANSPDCTLMGTAPDLNMQHLSVDTPPPSRLPRYFRMITSEVVYGDLLSVQNNAISIQKRPNTTEGGEPSLLVSALERAMKDSPVDGSTLQIMSQAKGRLYDMSADERVNAINLKQLHYAIMHINYLLWTWLRNDLRFAASKILVGLDVPCTWLKQILEDIQLCIRQRCCSVRFVPSAYGIQVKALAPAIVNFEDHVYDLNNKVLADRHVLDVLYDIVAFWYGYDHQSTSVWQAAYVARIIGYIGDEALYLDCVWKTYQRVTEAMMDGQFTVHLALNHGSMVYPQLNPSSHLRCDLLELAGTVQDFVAGKFDGVSNVSSDAFSLRLEQVLDKRVESFKKLVRDSFTVHFLGGSSENQELDNALRNKPDRYLMFREHAPSRMHVTESGGPFSPSNVRTIEALFSALLFRATTFDTTFARTGRTLFKSPEDFFAATKEAQCNQPRDYCNVCAYGQPDPGRKPELVYDYWNSLHEHPWPGLSATSPIGFMDSYHYFYPGGSPARFSHLGRLGAYLLTADYVYAGVVQPPKASELATVIKQLNKGAMSAFEQLGFSNPRNIGYRGKKNKLTDGSVEDMLERASELVMSSIPAEWHACIGLDYIVTEHALCKFSRLTSGPKAKVLM